MVFAVTTVGCRDLGDPDSLAKAFVDAYYVEYDFDRALALSEGPAKARLTAEKSLVDEARQKVEVANARSRTYYEAPERHDVGPDMVHYTFPMQIKQGSSDLKRTAVVMLARRDGVWRVLGFRESGPEGTRTSASGLGSDEGPTASGPDPDGVRTSSRALRARQEIGAKTASVAP